MAAASWCRIAPAAVGYSLRFACGGERDFRACVEDLKASVPPRWRTWRPEQRTWHVGPDAWPGLRAWAERWFRDGELVIGPDLGAGHYRRTSTYQQTSVDPRTEAYRALHLLPTAPPEVVRAVYRTLATLHHPDKGGDTAAMQRVNLAYEALGKGAA